MDFDLEIPTLDWGQIKVAREGELERGITRDHLSSSSSSSLALSPYHIVFLSLPDLPSHSLLLPHFPSIFPVISLLISLKSDNMTLTLEVVLHSSLLYYLLLHYFIFLHHSVDLSNPQM